MDYTRHDELAREVAELREAMSSKDTYKQRVEESIDNTRRQTKLEIAKTRLETERKRLIAEALHADDIKDNTSQARNSVPLADFGDATDNVWKTIFDLAHEIVAEPHRFITHRQMQARASELFDKRKAEKAEALRADSIHDNTQEQSQHAAVVQRDWCHVLMYSISPDGGDEILGAYSTDEKFREAQLEAYHSYDLSNTYGIDIELDAPVKLSDVLIGNGHTKKDDVL